MSKPKKIVIKLGMPSAKNRTEAMALAAKVHGVSSVAITGDDKDQLEVVGVGIDTTCLVCRLRKKVIHSADIQLVEEVKDKKEEEEEKKKKEEEEEKKKLEEMHQQWRQQWHGHYHPPPLMIPCEEQATGCHIM